MALALRDLEARLWSAANALRGPVDPADFKTYVFPMLFWKWISDNWDYEHLQAISDYADDLNDEIEADYHRFVLPTGSAWSTVTTKTDNLGTRVATALGKIEQANPSTLAGIFGDAAWGNKERLPEPALVALIGAFNGLTLNPENVSHDMLGQAYEYLLKQFADVSGQKAGEFFTPREVVHLLVGILDPQAGETICDPAAGSGGMLDSQIAALDAEARGLRRIYENSAPSLWRELDGSEARVRRLGEVMQLDIHRVPLNPDRVYPLAGVLNAGKGMIDKGRLRGCETDYKALNLLVAGRVVMRKLTAWEGPITVVPEEFNGFYASNEFPTFALGDDVLPAFFGHICRSPRLWTEMRLRVTGSVQRRKRLNPDQLLDVALPIPTVATQTRVAAALDELLANEASLIAEVAALRSVRSGVLTVLLSGERPIPESYDALLEAAL